MKLLAMSATLSVLLPGSLGHEPRADHQENRVNIQHEQTFTEEGRGETPKRQSGSEWAPRKNTDGQSKHAIQTEGMKDHQELVNDWEPKENKHHRKEEKHPGKHEEGQQKRQLEQVREGQTLIEDQTNYEPPQLQPQPPVRFQRQEDLWALMDKLKGPHMTDRVSPIDHPVP